jgi:hypothetical protein
MAKKQAVSIVSRVGKKNLGRNSLLEREHNQSLRRNRRRRRGGNSVKRATVLVTKVRKV